MNNGKEFFFQIAKYFKSLILKNHQIYQNTSICCNPQSISNFSISFDDENFKTFWIYKIDKHLEFFFLFSRLFNRFETPLI